MPDALPLLCLILTNRLISLKVLPDCLILTHLFLNLGTSRDSVLYRNINPCEILSPLLLIGPFVGEAGTWVVPITHPPHGHTYLIHNLTLIGRCRGDNLTGNQILIPHLFMKSGCSVPEWTQAWLPNWCGWLWRPVWAGWGSWRSSSP